MRLNYKEAHPYSHQREYVSVMFPTRKSMRGYYGKGECSVYQHGCVLCDKWRELAEKGYVIETVWSDSLPSLLKAGARIVTSTPRTRGVLDSFIQKYSFTRKQLDLFHTKEN